MFSKSPCQRVKYLPNILNHLKALNHSKWCGMNSLSTHKESLAQLTKSIRGDSKPKLEKKKSEKANTPEIYEWKSLTNPQWKVYQEWVDRLSRSHTHIGVNSFLLDELAETNKASTKQIKHKHHRNKSPFIKRELNQLIEICQLSRY